jgi:hypothetical protein
MEMAPVRNQLQGVLKLVIKHLISYRQGISWSGEKLSTYQDP